MIYTLEKAVLLTEQLRRFRSGYAHHLAGQCANIEFWVMEAESALRAIDEYNSRFNQMRDAQHNWVEAHGTVIHNYCPICQGRCEFSDGVPQPPRRVANQALNEARKDLSDAGYDFLLRCFKVGALPRSELEHMCQRIDSGLDPADLVAKE